MQSVAHLLFSAYKLVLQTLHSETDVELVEVVVNPLGQISQNERSSRKEPTLQMH